MVAGTDGRYQAKVAFMMDKHDTVGIDVVAYCVNDIICQGAEPLFSWTIWRWARTAQRKLRAL